MSATIVLVPIGPVPTDLRRWLAGRLAKTLERKVKVGAEMPLPEAGYDPLRRQYRGEALLDALAALPYPNAGRILGLTEADCYAPRLNFIFGQARLGGREAVVALPRLRQTFYSLPPDPPLFRQRVLKEAVHELGHTWGLSHCPDASCVMHFSNSLGDTDDKGAKFCLKCWGRLAHN